MRFRFAFVTAVTLFSLAGIVSQAGAQTANEVGADGESRPFINSWFWGLKGGWASISTDVDSRKTESSVGVDWLITRTRGGLYLAYDQSGFYRQSSIEDQSASSGRRVVNISNLRRFTAAALMHPRTFGPLRPYAGLGVSLQVVGTATPVPDTPTDAVSQATLDDADDARSRAALLFMAGVQAQTGRVAIFMQESVMPANRKSYFNNTAMPVFEMGIRYNFGGSIEKN